MRASRRASPPVDTQPLRTPPAHLKRGAARPQATFVLFHRPRGRSSAASNHGTKTVWAGRQPGRGERTGNGNRDRGGRPGSRPRRGRHAVRPRSGSPRPTAGTPTAPAAADAAGDPRGRAARADDARAPSRPARSRSALDRAVAELDARERARARTSSELAAAGARSSPHLRDEHERALERVAGLSAGQAKQAAAQGGRGPGAPRRGRDPAPGRGGDQARRRAPRALDPLRRHAAPRRQPRGRDDRLGRPAAQPTT